MHEPAHHHCLDLIATPDWPLHVWGTQSEMTVLNNFGTAGFCDNHTDTACFLVMPSCGFCCCAVEPSSPADGSTGQAGQEALKERLAHLVPNDMPEADPQSPLPSPEAKPEDTTGNRTQAGIAGSS